VTSVDTIAILTVDDEDLVRRVVQQTLERSYEVVAAANGQQALEHARTRRFDLVILDIKMPGMSGLDLADRLRELHPDLPIAFLSSFLDGEIRGRAKQRTPYIISKPYDLTDLNRLVKMILEETRGARGASPPSSPKPRPGEPVLSRSLLRFLKKPQP